MFFMIVDERRDLKLYVIFVRVLLFTSIKDVKFREFCDVLKVIMENFGMVVVGKEVYSLRFLFIMVLV